MKILGIDPGKSGALSCLDCHIPENYVIIDPFVSDTPLKPISTKHKKTEFDINRQIELVQILTNGFLERGEPCIAYLERVSARPGEGVTSSFNFGEGYGIWKGILKSISGLELRLVHPLVWKRRLGLIKAEKDASRLLALENFGVIRDALKRKKDHGRAEALLIAQYGLMDQLQWQEVCFSQPALFGNSVVMKKGPFRICQTN